MEWRRIIITTFLLEIAMISFFQPEYVDNFGTVVKMNNVHLQRKSKTTVCSLCDASSDWT